MRGRRRDLKARLCLKRRRVVYHKFFPKRKSLPSSIDKPYSSEKLVVEPLELFVGFEKVEYAVIATLSQSWNSDQEAFDLKFKTMQAMFCPCVCNDSNMNLSGHQRKLLLWH